VAREDGDGGTRARAASRLSNQVLLEEIARRDPSPEARKEAVVRLTDPNALNWILLDPDGEVRAEAVRSLPGTPAIFARTAQEDPSALVRKYAVSRLLDPPLLDRILRDDPSTGVRETALRRLSDPALLAAYLENGPDWRLRTEAVSMVRDPVVLARRAATEPDEDVREALWRRLYEMDRLDAIEDEGLRDRVRRFNQEAVPLPDPRVARLKAALSQPVMMQRFGPLEVRVDREMMERRYVREREGGGYPPLRGRVLVERLTVQVLAGDGWLLAERFSRGNKPGKGQAFDDRLPLVNEAWIKHNNAAIDTVGICGEILKPLVPEDLRTVTASENKYLRAAAQALLNP